MKQRQHIFQSWAIEVITVLLASTISFPVSDAAYSGGYPFSISGDIRSLPS